MNILITAGNTFVPIDEVRGITNVFTGRTGADIAAEALRRGHQVHLLTSRPEIATASDQARRSFEAFRTFEELQDLMEKSLRSGEFQACIHSAAVSDFQTAGVYAPAPHTHFVTTNCVWQSRGARPPGLVDRSAAKIKSDEPELWLRLVRTPKLVDRVRADWNFRGILVKFKLEAAVSDEELLEIAERSRAQSDADLMVANTLEARQAWAFVGAAPGHYERVERNALPSTLLNRVEQLGKERGHG
jgi:phosphopantothenoylcysteine synthetase/decarboxylase